MSPMPLRWADRAVSGAAPPHPIDVRLPGGRTAVLSRGLRPRTPSTSGSLAVARPSAAEVGLRAVLGGVDRVAASGALARQVDDVAGAEAVVGEDVIRRHVLGPAGERGVPHGGVAGAGLHGVGVGPGADDEPVVDQLTDAVGVADRV